MSHPVSLVAVVAVVVVVIFVVVFDVTLAACLRISGVGTESFFSSYIVFFFSIP